ncbi:DUF5682 family protein [Actinosynnema mirum]|uniref:Uncharacterized protein n=1 Tax=Actinosynnema mirum (strain ATCC 29888 / DSM 43827 / JCM 3225 / NBRC 14064 / NCIMB 13271 / NRRL B-12336 / IMRU 3971 / 101) TaxID=446462 RepID=C6WE91_ACTMD|nr:DUF5682 family protein [Actinosynnema mirum]ACU35834.1 conserved hypothetical protein [Actinosynnema mirum DSM 43827]
MGAVYLGVRHHSPACSALVDEVIRGLRPAHVLVEGPADVNGRLDELLLGHELPIALYSYRRDEERAHASWSPFCDYSPEWVALNAGREVGAQVRFIDLPSWHPAFWDVRNRYADAAVRHARAVELLCAEFAVDNVDALWDHLFEIPDREGLAERLDAYFDLIRGGAEASAGDRAREEHMASWVRAALADAGDAPVVVVTGGFHTPALRALVEGRQIPERVDRGVLAPPVAGGGDEQGGEAEPSGEAGPGREADPRVAPFDGGHAGHPPVADPTPSKAALDSPTPSGWPEVPQPAPGSVGASYLVPYSFRRLDAFTGYESGMPSPAYYQRLWESGRRGAAEGLLEAVVTRLRKRKQVVSTADLIAARTQAEGLAVLRGHPVPARVDVLDGLTSALVSEDLTQPPPWTRRGVLAPGAHPAVVEMVAALSGDRVGRLHPDTPAPPLVASVQEAMAALGLDGDRTVDLDLTDPRGLERSRLLHRLRVLDVPGLGRTSGPGGGGDPEVLERWRLVDRDTRVPALIEAAAHGATPAEAAGAVLRERARDAGIGDLSALLFDTALCGVGDLPDDVLDTLVAGVGRAPDLVELGGVLADVLGLWRHDRVFGSARDPRLGQVLDAGVTRALWLAEGLRGPTAPAEPHRLAALTSVRDTVVHAPAVLGLGRDAVADVGLRISRDPGSPPDLRGAGFGLAWALGAHADPEAAVRGTSSASVVGDWLAGLFALAREEVLDAPGVIAVLDEVVEGFTGEDFLEALPALRQAFAFFPPAERERIAGLLLAHRGVDGSARELVRSRVDPALHVEATTLEAFVDGLLAREGLA